MNYSTQAPNERRVLTRVPFEQAMFWNLNSSTNGTGMLGDVSRGGLKIYLDEIVRIGPVIEVSVDSILYQNRPIRLQALIRWCRPTEDSARPYEAGLCIIHGDPDVLGAISEVFYAAIQRIRTAGGDAKVANSFSENKLV